MERLQNALRWMGWTLALVVVVGIALVFIPSVIVWCLLFDTD